MKNPFVICWFRKDLRLSDNPALCEALKTKLPILPLFIHAPEEEGPWRPGAASQWWLHHSLTALNNRLRDKGAQLHVRAGNTINVLEELCETYPIQGIFWNRRYEPAMIERDKHLKSLLRTKGLQVKSFNASLLHEPGSVLTKTGNPYQVFTPFYKASLAKGAIRDARPEPKTIPAITLPNGVPVQQLSLLPKIAWDKGFYTSWKPGENQALQQAETFMEHKAEAYASQRDVPGRAGTARLSPHLHFGEISPVTLWEMACEQEDRATSWMRQLIWRDFAYHLLYFFPETPQEPLRAKYGAFPWQNDAIHLNAWQQGKTGYPMVDAGMRELWHTGWMHNRVRMIVASFLVKHLLIPWQEGARWFWDTLVDADLANNTLGWQWAAGCGADAAPYFRIFNPMSQGEKFDLGGAYVRRWVPEIAALPDTYLYQPFGAPKSVLNQAGIQLGETYPQPIVDHKEARTRALEAYETIKA